VSLEIIAEAAQGFAGDPPAKTLALVDCAAAAGADAVKFQLVYADELCTPDYVHFDLFRSLEMADAQWAEVAARCRARGIRLYLDVFGRQSLELAGRLGVGAVKLHSTDLLNFGLIELVASCPVSRVLLSAGGAFEGELDEAVQVLSRKDLVLMHGFQGYPTALEDNQIARIAALHCRYPDRAIGFADHVPEGRPERLWLSAVAVGAGATVLEKHITRALVLRDEDYESALNPDDFAQYASHMRQAVAAVGSGGETAGMSPSERAYRDKMKKQVVAARALRSGGTLAPADLCLKRTPATDGVFRDLRETMGRRLRQDVAQDVALRVEDLE
jgi:N,N'-diacetyllegionaminate synthase